MRKRTEEDTVWLAGCLSHLVFCIDFTDLAVPSTLVCYLLGGFVMMLHRHFLLQMLSGRWIFRLLSPPPKNKWSTQHSFRFECLQCSVDTEIDASGKKFEPPRKDNVSLAENLLRVMRGEMNMIESVNGKSRCLVSRRHTEDRHLDGKRKTLRSFQTGIFAIIIVAVFIHCNILMKRLDARNTRRGINSLECCLWMSHLFTVYSLTLPVINDCVSEWKRQTIYLSLSVLTFPRPSPSSGHYQSRVRLLLFSFHFHTFICLFVELETI